MEHLIDIPGRLHSVAIEKHVAGTDQIYDDILKTTLDILNLENITDVKVQDGKLQFLNIQGLVLKEISIFATQKQSDWNLTDSTQVDFIKGKPTVYNKLEVDDKLLTKQDTINDIATIRSGAQAGAAAYQKPSNGIPATDLASDVQSDIAAIDGIEAVIPEQASSSNKLADKNFVNSSIATATATYRGTYNLVTDLSLTISAAHAQIATALVSAIQTADNNDYCFVQIPVADDTPTEIASVERYKFNGTAWEYEYTLNNSGYTAAQWEAINSSITSGLVAKLSALPTNSELTTLLNGKADITNLIPVDSIWQWSNTAYLRATDIQTLDGIWIDKSATSATKEKYIYINKLSSNLLVYTDRYYSYSFNNGFVIPVGQQIIRDENMTHTMQTALLHIPYSGLLSLWMGTPSQVTASDQYVEILDSENNVIKHYSSYTLSNLNSPIILKINSGNYYIRYHRVNFFFHSAMLVRYELPLSELLDDTTHRLVTDDEKTAWNNKSNFSGSYNDLSDKPDLSDFITNSVDNLVNYYLKSETYTKNEVLQLIGAIQQFHYEVYPTLPQTGASNVLYLIGPTGSGSDKYEEYVYANNDWTKIGDTSIDLSGYVTTQTLNTALADYVTSSTLSTTLANYYNKNDVDGLLAGKADKSEMSVVQGTGANADKTTITLKQGTSATVLTAHQDITGKEDITPIEAVASGTTAITAQVNKYYEVADTVSSLTVTLPTPTANTEVTMVVVHLTVGASPTILVTSVNEVVKFSAAYSVVANKEYELSCLYNGSKWIVSSMEVAV